MFKDLEGQNQIWDAEIGLSEALSVRWSGILVLHEAIDTVVAQEPAQKAIASANVNGILDPKKLRNGITRGQIAQHPLRSAGIKIGKAALVGLTEPIRIFRLE